MHRWAEAWLNNDLRYFRQVAEASLWMLKKGKVRFAVAHCDGYQKSLCCHIALLSADGDDNLFSGSSRIVDTRGARALNGFVSPTEIYEKINIALKAFDALPTTWLESAAQKGWKLLR
jgi:hypothetical protein